MAPGLMGNIGQIAGVHNITNYMILDSKSCVCSIVAARAVGFSTASRGPVVRDWGRQQWQPNLVVCKFLGLIAGTQVQW